MPAGEEMFKFHGYSGDCPKPPLPRPAKVDPYDQGRRDVLNAILALNPKVAQRLHVISGGTDESFSNTQDDLSPTVKSVMQEFDRGLKQRRQKEAKPTPGPWFPVWTGHFYDICAEDREHAQSFASVHENSFLGINREASGANARLIAAAPEMLAALKRADCELSIRIRCGLTTDAEMSGEQASALVDANPAVILIRAAIAKASS
jgi:hypothetical protein